MVEKVKIDELPVTEEFLKEKRIIQGRGELALIVDGRAFKHLGYFSLNPGDNYFRGGHYHKVKTEHFYVIAGRLQLFLVDIESGEKEEIVVRAGHRVQIRPMCAHMFKAIEYAQVIEYYEGVYDPGDDYSYQELRNGKGSYLKMSRI